VLLFVRIDVLGVAWLRIASAAVIFALWRRPWRTWSNLDRTGRRHVIGLGTVLAAMNCFFYLAIDRLPLSTVAAIEFLPVIALAALAVRSRRNGLALLLAADERGSHRRADRHPLRIGQRAALRRLHRARPPGFPQ
jgi:inner membrane transporter RhtA